MAVKDQKITDKYAIYLGDCGEVMQALPKESIHLSIYSPPFGGLYCYSSSERDLSNADDYKQFFKHYQFIVKEIGRVTMPGRMTAVHCMDIASGNTGNDYLVDFPGDIIRLHESEGWRYVARYCVWKEPLALRNRTLMKSLFHTTVIEDSSRCSNASADYLLVFRRKGTNPIPIVHPTGLMNYAGERQVPAEFLKYRGHEGSQLGNKYSQWIWRQYASAFWDDIRIWRTLPFKNAREEGDEQVPHPLQLDVIERALALWSNPGETVLTPFMGVGSEVCAALVNGYRAIGIELKTGYFNQSKRNIAYYLEHGFGELESTHHQFAEEETEEIPQATLYE